MTGEKPLSEPFQCVPLCFTSTACSIMVPSLPVLLALVYVVVGLLYTLVVLILAPHQHFVSNSSPLTEFHFVSQFLHFL